MDIVTYALLTKKIKTSSTGVDKIELRLDDITGDYYMVFMMADRKEIKVKLPIKPDCIDFKIVSALPISDISPTTVYLTKKPGSGDIYYQYIYTNNQWILIGTSGEVLASTQRPGLVQPDGTTIGIDENAIISVQETGIKTFINNYFDDEDNDIENSEIDKLFK